MKDGFNGGMDQSVVILAYNPVTKKLLISGQHTPRIAIEVPLDCGPKPLAANQVTRLSKLIAARTEGTTTAFCHEIVFRYAPTDYCVMERPDDVDMQAFVKRRLPMQTPHSREVTYPLVIVDDNIFEFQKIDDAVNAKDDYTLKGIVDFVERTNIEFGPSDLTLTLRIKGATMMSLDFDGIRVVKQGELIENVGYAEIRRRIDSVANKI